MAPQPQFERASSQRARVLVSLAGEVIVDLGRLSIGELLVLLVSEAVSGDIDCPWVAGDVETAAGEGKRGERNKVPG
jgi:hypothetical protein